MHSDNHTDTLAQRFDGRYSDGTTARSHDVEIRLSQRGLLIYEPDSTTPVVWPYSSLSVAEPIRKNSIDALVTSTQNEGATVFVSGATFSRALAQSAPGLAVHHERWRNTRPWLLAAGAFATLVAVIYVADLSPARYFASLIPTQVRDSLGRNSIDSLIDGRGVCTAGEGQKALDRLVARLSSASGSDLKLHVTVADWDLVNAFTTPGAHIVATRALISKARTPDEVAGVIAHEIGHGISLHPETAVVRVLGLSLMIELMTGGSGSTAANLGLVLAQLSYTRSAEREADEHALAILKRAKISPDGLEQFFKRISSVKPKKKKTKNAKAKDTKNIKSGEDADSKTADKKEKDKKEKDGGSNKAEDSTDGLGEFFSAGLDILRTHPHAADRLKRINAQPKYDSEPAMTASEWTALRAICSQTRGKSAKRTKQKTSWPPPKKNQ